MNNKTINKTKEEEEEEDLRGKTILLNVFSCVFISTLVKLCFRLQAYL
jgi:hypothetical protein